MGQTDARPSPKGEKILFRFDENNINARRSSMGEIDLVSMLMTEDLIN